jgi:pentatricopeptide repeat protein
VTNSLLLERLQAVHDELEIASAIGSEEFMLLALDISRTTTRAAFAELIAASRAGKTDVELVASVPLAVGFLLNCVLNACGCDGNAEVADRLFDKIRTVVRELGDGAHQDASVSPISCH